MNFKNEEEKVVYYSRYIPALMGVASEAGDVKPSLVVYASSDGETYNSSVDAHSSEYFVTSDDFMLKITEELVAWAKSEDKEAFEKSEELSSFVERVRAIASERFLEEFPHE
jgi:hypothetical protein